MCKNCYYNWFRVKNKERHAAVQKKWRQNNQEKVRLWWTRKRDYPPSYSKYGLTLQEYGELAIKFQGVYPICSRTQINRRLSVDHNHITGLIRGMLCSNCNTALGCFLDNPEWLRRAALYIEGRLLNGVDQ